MDDINRLLSLYELIYSFRKIYAYDFDEKEEKPNFFGA